MRIGVMNNPRASVYEQIETFAKAGFDFVDLTIEGPTIDVDVPRVQSLLDTYGLHIVGHTDPCLPWAYPIEAVQEACFTELRRNALVFSRLGAKIMNIHPCYACPPGMKQGLVAQNIAALKPLAAMAGDLGLMPALENFKAPFDAVSVFKTILQEVPGLQLHLDAGHTNIGRDSTEAFCFHLGSRIKHVHLSDNRGSDDHHMPLGAGNIDWTKTVRALQEAGYDDTITLEVFCGSEPVLLSYLDTSRRYLMDLWGLGI